MDITFKEELLDKLLEAKGEPYDIQDLIIKHCRNINEPDKTNEAISRSRIYNRVLLDLKQLGWMDFYELGVVKMTNCHFEPGNPDPFNQGPHIVFLTQKGEIGYKTEKRLEKAANKKEKPKYCTKAFWIEEVAKNGVKYLLGVIFVAISAIYVRTKSNNTKDPVLKSTQPIEKVKPRDTTSINEKVYFLKTLDSAQYK